MQYEIVSQSKAEADKKVITKVQKDYYQRDGFLILKDFIPARICDSLRQRSLELVNEFNPDEVKAIFSSKNTVHENQLYFLQSGDKISFFFEEGSFDGKGHLTSQKELSINKIGHALHDLDSVFFCFSRLHKIAALCQDLDIIDPQIVQSMYIFKQPHIGGEVTCHQDSTYLLVKDQPITGFWFALEDATLQNGCLWAIPGGHKTKLKSRMMRDRADHTSTEVYDESLWPLEKMIPLEVTRGTLVVLHGMLPHMSKENISDKSRHAYTLHVMSGKAEYAKDNWLKKPEDKSFSALL